MAPLVRIFHVPTVTDLFWEAIASLDLLDKVTETLLFTIYYAAVISLTPEECRSKLGDERTSLLARYRFAVEQALARANLLNTQSVMLIQASVLFLSALRNEDDSRVVWSMTALVFHLAQVMGLHRDGTVFGLKPFETEIRRRIWWHICLLDARSSEDHGCELIVHDAVFDTQMPSNINDSDLSRGMTELPKEREEATEMTFCLMRCHVTRSMRRIGYVPPSMRGADRAPDKPSPETRAALMMDLRNTLDERYIRYCDESIPFFLASATVGRLICARMFVAVHHPNSHKEPISSNTRDQLFSSSIEVIQFSNQLLTDPTLVQWNWYFKTHIQWHTVAFVLSEICARPPSAECDRAWNLVTTMYDRWEPKEQERNAHLGRPLGRLMERTRRTRENQRASASVLAGKWDPNQPNLRGAADPSCATSGSLLATAGDGLIPSGMDHLPRDPFFEGFDPFLWGPVAPMALESTNNFNPLAFDPAAFPAVPSGADNLC